MKTDKIHITKYEFSFEKEHEIKVIEQGGSHLTISYNMLWIVSYEDSVYLAFFVAKTKLKATVTEFMTTAVCFSLTPKQFIDIIDSFPKQISLHKDSMVKGDNGSIKVFYNDELYRSYDSFPKFINIP